MRLCPPPLVRPVRSCLTRGHDGIVVEARVARQVVRLQQHKICQLLCHSSLKTLPHVPSQLQENFHADVTDQDMIDAGVSWQAMAGAQDESNQKTNDGVTHFDVVHVDCFADACTHKILRITVW